MRHRIVTRACLALAAVLAAAALAFAWHHAELAPAQPPRTAEPRAAEAFDLHCAACHDLADLAADLAAAPDRAAAVLDLLAFLEEHGDAAPDEDLAVARELLEAARPDPDPGESARR